MQTMITAALTVLLMRASSTAMACKQLRRASTLITVPVPDRNFRAPTQYTSASADATWSADVAVSSSSSVTNSDIIVRRVRNNLHDCRKAAELTKHGEVHEASLKQKPSCTNPEHSTYYTTYSIHTYISEQSQERNDWIMKHNVNRHHRLT